MDEMQDVMEQQDEIDRVLQSHVEQPSEEEQADFEAELDKLLAEETAQKSKDQEIQLLQEQKRLAQVEALMNTVPIVPGPAVTAQKENQGQKIPEAVEAE